MSFGLTINRGPENSEPVVSSTFEPRATAVCFSILTLVIVFVALQRALYAAEVPAPIGKLDPTAPALPNNAKDLDKLQFAARSLWWARSTYPIRDFQPDPSGKLRPVEWQLLEGIVCVGFRSRVGYRPIHARPVNTSREYSVDCHT